MYSDQQESMCNTIGDSSFFLFTCSMYVAYTQMLGPILHPVQLTFYTDACIVATLPPAQSRFFPAALAPLQLRLERRVGEKQSRVPPQMILGTILVIFKFCQCNCATNRKNTWFIADNAVGVAILTCHGRSELQHKLTNT